MDLVVTNSTNLDIFFGNGDGTFQMPIITNIGTGLGSVVVVDLNNDGELDVVGLSPAALVFVLLGKGNGTFAPGVMYPALTNTTNLLTVADFNNDGKLDITLAAGNGTGTAGSLGVLLGNGDGTFQTVITSTGITNPFSFVAKDFNGDGKLDLAISGTAGNQTYIFFGNGDGTFQAPGPPLSVFGVLATADMNGDGKPDLVVGGDPFAEVFLGKGDGTFSRKSSYLIYSGRSVVVADFNGDGKLDLASGNSILLGNGDGTLRGNFGTPLPASSVGTPNYLGPAVTGDFNRDGSPDIAFVSSAYPNAIYVLINDGAGKFTVVQTYTLDSPCDAIATVDLNGDGKLDLVFTTHDATTQDWTLNVMLGHGDGTFGPPSAFPQGVPGPVTKITIADFNADQVPDVAVITGGQLAVFLGNGSGAFAPPKNSFAGSGPTSLVAADFNGDEISDLAVISSAGLGILLGKGDGTFQSATYATSGVTTLIAAVDLNGDGKADLIASNFNFLQVLLGNGDGTFDVLPATNQALTGLVSLADINGNGKLDLVESQGVFIALGNGDGTFNNPIQVLFSGGQFFPSDPGIGFHFALVADFNGDGRPDVAVDATFDTAGIVTLLNTSPLQGPDFLISSSTSSATVTPGQTATYMISVAPAGGFAHTVVLMCTGAPAQSTCAVSPRLSCVERLRSDGHGVDHHHGRCGAVRPDRKGSDAKNQRLDSPSHSCVVGNGFPRRVVPAPPGLRAPMGSSYAGCDAVRRSAVNLLYQREFYWRLWRGWGWRGWGWRRWRYARRNLHCHRLWHLHIWCYDFNAQNQSNPHRAVTLIRPKLAPMAFRSVWKLQEFGWRVGGTPKEQPIFPLKPQPAQGT